VTNVSSGIRRHRVIYFDRQGRRIARQTWLALSARPEYVVVAKDSVVFGEDTLHVVTMWLGIATSTFQPALFQTVADPVRLPRHSRSLRWKWHSLQQAAKGHRRAHGA
jgi:hypothetical protein